MTTLTLTELRNKDLKTLQAELERAQKALIMSKMGLKLQQDKKSHIMNQHKSAIAQIEMVINEMKAMPQTPEKN